MLTLFRRLFVLRFTIKGNNWKKWQNKKKELGPCVKDGARHNVDALRLKNFEKIEQLGESQVYSISEDQL